MGSSGIAMVTKVNCNILLNARESHSGNNGVGKYCCVQDPGACRCICSIKRCTSRVLSRSKSAAFSICADAAGPSLGIVPSYCWPTQVADAMRKLSIGTEAAARLTCASSALLNSSLSALELANCSVRRDTLSESAEQQLGSTSSRR
eukprot:6197751-Pleurochrysis_carterae.AAC.2